MIKPLSDLKMKLKSYIVWLDMINRRTLQSQKPITNIKRYIFVKQVCGVLIETTLHCRDQGCVWNAYLNNISAWSEQIQTVGQIRIIYFTQIQYK